MRRAVARWVTGRPVVRVTLEHTKVWGLDRRLAAAVLPRLTGQHVQRVRRRGKFLLLELEKGSLLFHFRLNGKLVWQPAGTRLAHRDFSVGFPRGTLVLVDPRHLAKIYWTPKGTIHPSTAHLGLEPLSPAFTAKRLRQLLAGHCQPVKVALTDQRRLAGIGNIYSCEALWEARLDPRRPAGELTAEEVRRLHRAIVRVLRRALQSLTDPLPDITQPAWWFHEPQLGVYGRAGLPCRRCGAAVQRLRQQGRSTYCCLRCQN